MSEPTTTLSAAAAAQQPTTTTTSSSASSTPGASSTSSTSPSYYSTSSSSATSHSSTPTPTVHSLAPTPAPSRNPSLFPGADNSPAALGLGLGGLGGSNGRTTHHLTAGAQPGGGGGRHFANNADYINALAAAAQASLQSAPSSPGADLPIARGKRGSVYGAGNLSGGGVGGGSAEQYQQQQSLPERLNEMLVDEERERERVAERERERETEGEAGENGEKADRVTELPPLMTSSSSSSSMHPPTTTARAQQPAFDPARGSFLDVDSITPVTTPGSVDHQGILWSGGGGGAPRGGPVSGAPGARAVDEMEVEEEEEEEEEQGQYEGFVDPFARARAGVSVAKGEGLVQQAGVMMNGHQHQQQQRSAQQDGGLDGTSDRQ